MSFELRSPFKREKKMKYSIFQDNTSRFLSSRRLIWFIGETDRTKNKGVRPLAKLSIFAYRQKTWHFSVLEKVPFLAFALDESYILKNRKNHGEKNFTIAFTVLWGYVIENLSFSLYISINGEWNSQISIANLKFQSESIHSHYCL